MLDKIQVYLGMIAYILLVVSYFCKTEKLLRWLGLIAGVINLLSRVILMIIAKNCTVNYMVIGALMAIIGHAIRLKGLYKNEKKSKKITLLLIMMSIILQSCVTYEVKRLGGMKKNEEKLNKEINKQLEESYKLHLETYNK